MERKKAIIVLVLTEINYGNDLQILREVIITHFKSFRVSRGFRASGSGPKAVELQGSMVLS